MQAICLFLIELLRGVVATGVPTCLLPSGMRGGGKCGGDEMTWGEGSLWRMLRGKAVNCSNINYVGRGVYSIYIRTHPTICWHRGRTNVDCYRDR